MSRALLGAAVGLLVAGSAAIAAGRAQAPVPYPDGYRSWKHVKSMVILEGHALADPFAGIHHIYANGKALRGLENGKYADGSVLVFDLLEAVPEENAYVEGPRKLIGVMHKNARRYAATGGWGFEAFAGDSKTGRLPTNNGRDCHLCHTDAAETELVFTAPRN
jgi:hypothetical protein